MSDERFARVIGITGLSGQVLANRLSDAPAIATFHPRFVMR